MGISSYSNNNKQAERRSENTLLAFFGQKDLTIYFTANIITYLVITLLYVYLNPRARRALNSVGVVLFGGVMVVVALKVIEIMSSR